MRRLLGDYPRAVAHLWQQRQRKQLGLIVGSGLSKDFGFPNWTELLLRIALDTGESLKEFVNVDDDKEYIRSPAAAASHLRMRLRSTCVTYPPANKDHRIALLQFEPQWRSKVQKALYADHSQDELYKRLTSADHYLSGLLQLIRPSDFPALPMVVNYNFDDLLERALHFTDPERGKRRGSTTVWTPDLELLPEAPVIYHPNGFLPMSPTDRQSEHLVFEDSSFDDQVLESMTGHYQTLINYLSQQTSLLLGLSLHDPNLKLLLRQGARNYPGHYHYVIDFLEDDGVPADPCETDKAHFLAYNLVTMHLNRVEIRELLHLLNQNDQGFKSACRQCGANDKHVFYLTGAVGSGKTSCLDRLRSLSQHEEWIAPRVAGMESDQRLLPEQDRDGIVKKIDDWVAQQFEVRNDVLTDSRPGIHILDRSPLDPLAFTIGKSWRERAKELLGVYSPSGSSSRLVSGHVFLLLDQPEEMYFRAITKGKNFTAGFLEEQQENFKQIFGANAEAPLKGVTFIYEAGMRVQDVVRSLSWVIFFPESVSELQLQKRLDKIALEREPRIDPRLGKEA